MAILPEGFALPPLPYLVGLLVAVGVVVAAVARRRPEVTPQRILAFVPWMILGSAVHVLYVVNALPPVIHPLGGTPAVYLSVGVLGIGTFVAAAEWAEEALVPLLTGVGTVLSAVAVAAAFLVGASEGTLAPVVPAIGLVVATVVSAGAWVILTRVLPDARITAPVGILTVFGHALDAVSTAVGIDLLGFSERTPLSRAIIEFAATLPTEPFFGTVWLFVLVKLVIVSGIVALFADYVREDPTEGNLLLGFVAAVGLGPGVHNLILFTILGGA
ncbi:hypothetical protein C499_02364 [Halogeometricum borinquense DSM 11551]|uniref:Predicted membrane protein n=2 Tax=Halogeometricum borinquense TaxID=60847 RepID=E4NPT0_HALBP|nr:DUF63 family protein [Halogeometricum borinquense]ADQ66563.1 predicted membrane protein [Halogeometricum borinquense DSM 11551]ELY30671.1 hypothetical protein C499_02364 [Halogeometricum borinquense DSM 11551]RYJ14422.1 DUF63 family protein [Halogeometricum borinquense]